LQIATSRIEVVAERRFGWIDLTDDLHRAIKDSGVVDGCAMAFCAHTTCTILINEWEDGALEDLEYRLEQLIPVAAYYAHDDLDRRTQNLVAEERTNGPAHVAQMILGGTSQFVPVEAGAPVLGTWQRLLLLELDEPKPRTCVFQIWGA
jgi:secondary thiamine-phosphate synthase enzyme